MAQNLCCKKVVQRRVFRLLKHQHCQVREQEPLILHLADMTAQRTLECVCVREEVSRFETERGRHLLGFEKVRSVTLPIIGPIQ